MSFLAGLIGLPQWVKEALFCVLILTAGYLWWQWHDHELIVEGEAKATAQLQKQGEKLTQDANQKINELNNGHAAALAEIDDAHDKELADANAAHAADLKRLQDSADLYRRQHPVLGGATCTTSQSGTDVGPGGAPRLGEVAAELADALRRDDARLRACRAERDSLTGK